MARTRDGDERAFEMLYRRHEGRLYAYLWRLLRDEASADELRQEAFFRLWQARESWAEGSVPAYLIGVARNLAVDRHRRRQVYHRWQEAMDQESPRHAPAADSLVLERDVQERVAAAIDELPDRPREVFMLKRDAALTYVEIGTLLGIAPKTVEVHMSRALRLLRASLADLIEPNARGGG